MKTPSEIVAREMLRDVLLGVNSKGKAIMVTTFASHLARLKSIIEFGKQLKRKVIFLGRSLAKYVEAGEKAGVVNFSKEVEIVKYSKNIQKRLKEIQKSGSEKYLLVVTGHQGEQKSVLYKIAKKEFKFNLYPEDNVVFSCRTIPTPTNIANREALENELKQTGVRIFKDIHQSGHAAREDLRDFIHIIKPKNIIPAHGNKEMREALADLAGEMEYKIGENVLMLKDGSKVAL